MVWKNREMFFHSVEKNGDIFRRVVRQLPDFPYCGKTRRRRGQPPTGAAGTVSAAGGGGASPAIGASTSRKPFTAPRALPRKP